MAASACTGMRMSGLSPKLIPGVAMCDAQGIMVATSPQHCALHDRTPEQIVGRNWQDWTSTEDLSRVKELNFRCFSGEPISFVKRIIQPDFTVVASHFVCFTRVIGHRLLMVSSSTPLPASLSRNDQGVIDVADYISELTAQLAEMAKRAGLDKLADDLESVASQAGDIAILGQGRK